MQYIAYIAFTTLSKNHGQKGMTRIEPFIPIGLFLFSILLQSCSDYFKNDYHDNSPTSGKLKVYYDEGLRLHVKNQAYTFESHYHHAHIELVETSENRCVQALYNDSCESIMISRQLSTEEQKAFESKRYQAKYAAVARSGIALIVNSAAPLQNLRYEDVVDLLSASPVVKDTTGKDLRLKILFDRNNSSVLHFILDSVLRGKKLHPDCNIPGSTLETIDYVAKHPDALGFIDYAWLSDSDDSLYKAYKDHIRFLRVARMNSDTFEFPGQSSFRLNTYPFTRTIYIVRKTGEFSLSKGFQTFVAGPKGQTTFLKQGLLPARQQERSIEINME